MITYKFWKTLTGTDLVQARTELIQVSAPTPDEANPTTEIVVPEQDHRVFAAAHGPERFRLGRSASGC
ncbi:MULTISPECIES: hypothetical protein [unclassified Streptomyces]|uniref:hypothetical protein n=1 Tax=unclassified Streptomyces TaxID=2593676 RepID=UPI003D8D445F